MSAKAVVKDYVTEERPYKDVGEVPLLPIGLISKKRIHSALSRTCWKNPPIVYPKSDVDSSGNEPMERLIARHLSGEVKPRFIPEYLPVGTSPEDAIQAMDPSRQPGFDLADASEALRRGREVAAALKSKSEPSPKDKRDVEKDEGGKSVDTPAAKAGVTGGVNPPAPVKAVDEGK